MLTSEEIALELVKIEKQKPTSSAPAEQKESIELYEEYLEKVHKAYSKNNSQEVFMSKCPIGTTGRTGEKCPESGVWKSGSTTIPLAKGNTFPPCNKKAATWKLIQYA